MDKFKIIKEGYTIEKDAKKGKQGKIYGFGDEVELSNGEEIDKNGKPKDWLEPVEVKKDNKKGDK